MFFDELNDAEWALVSVLIDDEPTVGMNRRGRPRVESRNVANAVLWIMTTREPWSKLPSYYPSGPTCRRRFAEWRSNGSLDEMTRLLSQTGRMLPSAQKSAPSFASAPIFQPDKAAPCVDTWGRVIWKSAESWKAPSTTTNNGRSLDPIASMTQQLSGSLGQEPDNESLRSVPQSKGQHGSMLRSLSRRATEFDGESGYVVSAGVEQLSNGMYRAWAEIMKDRMRVERSGLIGPRFADAEAAQRHALEWGRQWIDRQGRMKVAAASDSITFSCVSPAVSAVDEPMAVSAASIMPSAHVKMPRVPLRPDQRITARRASDRFPTAPKLVSYVRVDHNSARPPGATAAGPP